MTNGIEPGADAPAKEERTWAMACHLAALAGYLIPFGNVIGPLVVWILKKDSSEFVNDQGKEAINFQLTVVIAFLVCFLLMFVLVGVVLMIALGIYTLVMIIIAAVRANDGTRYRYPVAIRFLK